MATSRKDYRGYALRRGECQRQDGRYVFSYTDSLGKRRYIYAKTLQDLRKRERKIQHDIDDGIDPHATERMTLNKLYDRYMSQKYDLRDSTRANYLYLYKRFVRDGFGKRRVIQIKYSDIKKFYYSIIIDGKMKASTLEGIHTQLHPAFQIAVRDGILRVNPTEGVMAEIKKSKYWDKPRRHALTISEQEAFLNYVKLHREYKGWEPLITVLLGTGMRIGECLGLRWDDLDFENRIIHVKHTYIYHPNEQGKCEKHLKTTKTDAGVRTIPMIDEVFEAFLTEYEVQSCIGFNSETIDGYSNFIFVTAYGTIYSETSFNRALHTITEAHNREEEEKAKEAGSDGKSSRKNYKINDVWF